MWSHFLVARNLEIHRALEAGDTQRIAEVFADPGKTEIFYGFDGLFRERLQDFEADPAVLRSEVEWIFDTLLRLAEAVGAIRLENAEAAPGNLPPLLTPDEVLSALDGAFGLKIRIPKIYPNEPALKTKRGVINYRDVNAIFQAWRIKEILREHGGRSVLEIGGGLGRTAYYARQFGISDYTILDIPFTGVSQAHFLGTTLGKKAVTLHGEKFREGSIRIMQPEYFLDPKGPEFDLVLNVDSFTEMDAAIAKAYWSRIEKAAGIFLSVNHEYNPFRVRDFITGSRCVLRSSRTPYWMRRGYVEELVEFRRKRGVRHLWNALRGLRNTKKK
jgi:SAM-dependent methyltransferase